VVDAAMVDGAALLGAAFHGFVSSGTWNTTRGSNIVDSGAPFYDVYETADGKWLAVAAIEAHFYTDLLDVLGIDARTLPDQNDTSQWPQLRKILADTVRTRARDEWVELAAGRGCISAMLEPAEAWAHPHNVARGTFVELAGVTQPSPQPRFSRTPAVVDGQPPVPGEHTRAALSAWGIADQLVDEWVRSGAVTEAEEEERTVR
jgi:alpha-methylacyl-CoA racemase